MSGFDNNNEFSTRPEGGNLRNDRFDESGTNQSGLNQGDRAGRGMGMGNDDFTNTGTGGGNFGSSDLGTGSGRGDNFDSTNRGENFGTTGRRGDAFNDNLDPTNSTNNTYGGGFSDGLNGDSNTAGGGLSETGGFGAGGGRHGGHHAERFDDQTGTGTGSAPGYGNNTNTGDYNDSTTRGTGDYTDSTTRTEGEYGRNTDSGYGGTTGSNTYGDDSNLNEGHGGNHKPTMGQKVKGTIDETIGKITKNPTKIERGQELKSGEYAAQKDYSNQA